MKRLLSVLAAAVIFGSSAAAARAQDVYLQTRSPGLSQRMIYDALPGFRAGEADLQSWWGGAPVKLYLGTAPAGAWQITFKPMPAHSMVGGFHDVSKGVPFAIVYTGSGLPWQVILTHELFEMIVDPYVNRFQVGGITHKRYLVEVGDPVERQHYQRDGVSISDFIGPDWYRRNGRYFDFMHRLTRPEQLLPGGYACWNPTGRLMDWACSNI